MARILACLFAAITLMGCSTREVVKWKTKYVFVEMPPSLYSHVPAAAPPSEEVYVKAECQQREVFLIETLNANYRQLASCNQQSAAIREWTVKNKAIYETTPKE